MAAGGTHLAFDLGAESGRAFIGRLQAGSLELREVHRFPNEPVEYGRGLYWDAARLWLEVCRVLHSLDGTDITSVGIDAWGVDYALLGERGELLQNPRHYRDRRNVAAMEELLGIVSAREVYRVTGIQFMPINTLNQLFAAKRETPRTLAAAERLVMIPDLFHYWLSGNAACEFTAATTTQFVNPIARSWARDLLDRLGLPSQLPAPLVEPGSILGKLHRGLTANASLRETLVVTPASHDTASAVAAISARDDTAFLSSGTWSLLGMEVDAPIISDEAFRLNFTNEGGVCRTTRLLKNVMGLWMLQGCRRSWAARGLEFNYPELMDAAREAPAFHR
ncbi:MAG TPA: FGGY family carbohydrate kinase, partial [Bryobacteraceae bacterium]